MQDEALEGILGQNSPPARPTFKLEAFRNWLGSGKSAEVVAKVLGLSPGRLFARPGPLCDRQSRLDASERSLSRSRPSTPKAVRPTAAHAFGRSSTPVGVDMDASASPAS